MESLFQRHGAQPPHALHASGKTDVVAQHVAHLVLLAPAIEHALHPRQVAVEVSLQSLIEPLALPFSVERPPFGLERVEVLEHLVQEAAALHQHRARLRHQAGVMVVPVEARALEVVVEGRRAEMRDLDTHRVALAAVRFERLARLRVGQEGDVETERPRALVRSRVEMSARRRDHHLGLARKQKTCRLEPGRSA